MQGNLNEIDIRSILQLIELGQRTGQLFVETHSDYKCSGLCVDETDRHNDCSDRHCWFIFFLNGQIIYAANGDNSLSRLSDYLRHYQIQVQLDEREVEHLKTLNALEYAYLWMLLEQNILNPIQARSIIHSLVYETLFDLLNLQQGNFIFEVSSALAPQLTTLEIAPALTEMIKQVQSWKLLYPHIQTPDQIPVIADIVNLRNSLPAVTINKLQHWADGKTSLRQLARYLNRDLVTLAKAIHPYIQQGWVQLLTNKSKKTLDLEENRKRCILCIDDAITICTVVKSILSNLDYEVITQSNPLEALSLIFKLKPDLILCDITMPDLNGYEICAMLRHSQAFRQVPIIMLTAKEGFFDRVKAKMVGATDYLTKPFGNNELVILVEKYLSPFCIKSNKRDTPLVDSVKDRVKILSQN
ncbi:response regulator [Chlorogloeopsis sp. ULAP02]|uniref:response regulator n=1 Tax=Chlorogloeopsis sp. ULAP02 TaxID=3107926 RepID=UPI00313723A4